MRIGHRGPDHRVPPTCLLSSNELHAIGHIVNAPFSILFTVGHATVAGLFFNDARAGTLQVATSRL